MSLFNQLTRGGDYPANAQMEVIAKLGQYKKRTFREEIQDQIAALEAKKVDLQAVLDSLTPEVEKFVEAIQRIN